ncbi:YceI family protein [Flagellimonas sp. DF-77]|uniref:YceI family protein n=1 Tax=Flagellimonas algarum TaxID=3230298 RepID=UPI00339A3130
MKTLKTLVLLCLVIATSGTQICRAQSKFIDKTGSITFEASEKLFQEVKATTGSATAILDVATNQIAALALVKGFRFKNSLMQEHFNENYIESDTYPKAIFKGELLDTDLNGLDASPKTARIKGTLELHGVTHELDDTMNIHRIEDTIFIEGEFRVTPQDFAIEIPKIVRNKIAKEVLVAVNFKLLKK